jgi:hypothetical protein
MWILLISIAVALTIALIASKLSPDNTDQAQTSPEPPDADCCGAHEICDKETLIAHTRGEIVYFNDEELDRFRGKSPDEYVNDESVQFREVLLTMHPHEVSLWLRSLMVRGIKPPSEIREEALIILNQLRNSNGS